MAGYLPELDARRLHENGGGSKAVMLSFGLMSTRSSLTRRAFLATASAAGAAAMLPLPVRGSQPRGAAQWSIGSHTRPFSSFRLGQDELLDAIKAAGFKSADM